MDTITRLLVEIRAEQRYMHQRVNEIHADLKSLNGRVEHLLNIAKNPSSVSDFNRLASKTSPQSESSMSVTTKQQPNEIDMHKTDTRYATPTKRKLSPRKRKQSDSENDDLYEFLFGNSSFHEKLAKAINEHVLLQSEKQSDPVIEKPVVIQNTTSDQLEARENDAVGVTNTNTSTSSSHADLLLGERTLTEILEQLQRDFPEFDALLTTEPPAVNDVADSHESDNTVETAVVNENENRDGRKSSDMTVECTTQPVNTTISYGPIWVVPVPIALPQQPKTTTSDAADWRPAQRRLLPKSHSSDAATVQKRANISSLAVAGVHPRSLLNTTRVEEAECDDQTSFSTDFEANAMYSSSRSNVFLSQSAVENSSDQSVSRQSVTNASIRMSPSKIRRLLDRLHPST